MIILTCKADKVVIRGPEWGDTVSVIAPSVLRRSINGTPWTYIKKSKLQKKFTFAGQDRGNILQLSNFVKAHIGEEVKLLDLEHNVVWTGKIISPIESTDSGRSNSSMSLTLEGTYASAD